MMESCAESSTVFSAMIRLIVSSGMNMVARYLWENVRMAEQTQMFCSFADAPHTTRI